MRELWTKVCAFGRCTEITTPADLPDAQKTHTAEFVKAMTELRRREADRRAADGTYDREYQIDPLIEPWKPPTLKTGSKYDGTERLWKPALPVDWWKPPRPVTDKQARINAAKILGRDYVPRSSGWWGDGSAVTRDMFEVTYEEITEPDEE
jgi:hypothetical protein